MFFLSLNPDLSLYSVHTEETMFPHVARVTQIYGYELALTIYGWHHVAAILPGSSFKLRELEPVVRECYVVINQNSSTLYNEPGKNDFGRIFIAKAQGEQIKKKIKNAFYYKHNLIIVH